MSPVVWIAIILSAVLADLLLMRLIARRVHNQPQANSPVRLFGAYSPTLTWLRDTVFKGHEAAAAAGIELKPVRFPKISLKAPVKKFEFSLPALLTAGEVCCVLLLAIIVTKPYLTFDERIIPIGNEFPSSIQTHHLWTRLRECGACAMWNGSTRGGAPYFADAHGSMLHPLVIATTLGGGVVNGAKLALTAGFFIAGMAQWWLAASLGLGRLARLWSSLMAVAGGHLAVRMELGAFGVVLSMAMCALVIPALVYLFRTTSRRSAIVLGICLALAILAGQGYMQIGLFFSIIPAAVFLVPSFEREYLKKLFTRLLLSGLIAFLLAAPFLVPFLHFMPNFTKELDPEFGSAQPFEYIPLNLVIQDADFQRNESLEKLPFPHLNGNYIGWLTVGLAVCAVFMHLERNRRRTANFLLVSAFFSIWVASAIPLKWIISISPVSMIDEFMAGIRNPAQMAGLAGIALISLAGIGLDQILTLDWPQIRLSLVNSQTPSEQPVKLDLRWLLLVPLALSLLSVMEHGKNWIGVIKVDSIVQIVNQNLHTDTLQWINTPFGSHGYIEQAVAMGLKSAAGIRTWYWADRPFPEPVLEASFEGTPGGMLFYKDLDGAKIFKGPSDREYAQVIYSAEEAPAICRASGNSGDIDVVCALSKPGLLVVKENSWTGWYAFVDGVPTRLESGSWLSVALPPGEHQIEFRYRPWDVPLGVALWVLGLVLTVVLLLKPEIPDQPGEETGSSEQISAESTPI